MDYISELNSRQRQAVEHTEGPLLVIAGAGSGKTRVITYRIAYLIEKKSVDPKNILAITFTNKAAAEMRERVDSLVQKNSQDIWVSTFHSACVRILRQEIDKIGYDRNFVIFDTYDQKSLIKTCLKELNLDEKTYPPQNISAAIRHAKDRLMTSEEFSKSAGGNYRKEKIALIYKTYQEHLKKNNGLDFDDLIMKTVELFKLRPDVLEKYQDRFRYIMVDEYQDTNHAQYVLVNMLAQKHRNLCVVGDVDQSIYSWRGADINNILDFEEDYPDAVVIKLEQNYRSTENILNAANSIIENNFGRKKKNLWTEKGPGEKIKVFGGLNERDEARFIAEEIVRNIDKEFKNYKDFAVLYRTNAQSRVLEEEFAKKGIPYKIVGGLKFYERKEIKDITAYLKVISNPSDSISLRRIINVPKRGIGSATIAAVERYAEEKGLSLFDALKMSRDNPFLSRVPDGIYDFVELIEKIMEIKDKTSIAALVQQVLEDTGYLEELKKEDRWSTSTDSQGRLENLQEFVSVAKEFQDSHPDQGLAEFLAHISLVTDIDTFEDEQDAVALMTLHSAKGLEFPVVFITGMEEGIFPHSRSLFGEDELEEERRLCYVGITRAQEKAYLTFAFQRNLYGRSGYNPPSRFLEEIPDEYKEDVSFESEQGNEEGPEFKPGEMVYHDRWGEGIVVDVRGYGEGQEISVDFARLGIKRLVMRYAPISRLKIR